MHWTGTMHIVCHREKSVLQWSVISNFACNSNSINDENNNNTNDNSYHDNNDNSNNDNDINSNSDNCYKNNKNNDKNNEYDYIVNINNNDDN